MEFKDGYIIKVENLKTNFNIQECLLQKNSDFEVIKKLGKGSFGAVYQVKHLQMQTNNK